MIEVTFDRDARMLYCYFAEIQEGEDATQVECDGAFLLDADGQIAGLWFETAGTLLPQALRYAVSHPEVSLDDAGNLTIRFSATDASRAPLPYPAIFDLERGGVALGVEVAAESEFAIAERLRHVEPFIAEVYGGEDEDDEPDHLERVAVDESEDAASVQPAIAQARPDEQGPVPGSPPPAPIIRAGFVALLGRPNVGKSTLLNAYLGRKVSIVSPKPQTTRLPVRGILNRDDAQVIFVDTPGLHEPKSGLGEFMVQAARRAIPDSDVLCFMVDASEPPGALDRRIAELVKRARKPTILVLNKIDKARKADVFLRQYQELGPWDYEIAVSAITGEGMGTLLEEIVKRLPESPRLFEPDQITDLSEREQVAELIREKVLLNTQDEVPHGVAVEIEEWEQRGQRLYIRATVNVERETHKAIIIGEGGRMLKKIGSAARFEIERALNQPVFLDLWVKVRKDWRRDPSSLRWLGYDVRNLK